jgi:AmiR/NasT family two-component response regulator
VASVALVTGSATTDRIRLNQQLQTALDSRVFVEQAKGAIVQHANVTMNEAFTLLRLYSRDHNQRLTDVAQAVATRTLPVQQVAGSNQSAR